MTVTDAKGYAGVLMNEVSELMIYNGRTAREAWSKKPYNCQNIDIQRNKEKLQHIMSFLEGMYYGYDESKEGYVFPKKEEGEDDNGKDKDI